MSAKTELSISSGEVIARGLYALTLQPLGEAAKVVYLVGRRVTLMDCALSEEARNSTVKDGDKEYTLKQVRSKLNYEIVDTALSVIPIVGAFYKQFKNHLKEKKHADEGVTETATRESKLQGAIVGETAHKVGRLANRIRTPGQRIVKQDAGVTTA